MSVTTGSPNLPPRRGPGRPPARKDQAPPAAAATPSLDQIINNEEPEQPPAEPRTVTVHFVEDGLTLLGKVWCRGEEIQINEKKDALIWDLLTDATVGMLLDLDEDQQIARWGKRYFREGLWRGKGYDSLEDEAHLNEEEKLRLRQIEKDRERYRLPSPDMISSITRMATQ
jgi:hypothetical protein